LATARSECLCLNGREKKKKTDRKKKKRRHRRTESSNLNQLMNEMLCARNSAGNKSPVVQAPKERKNQSWPAKRKRSKVPYAMRVKMMNRK
jgi:hypothetical protein